MADNYRVTSQSQGYALDPNGKTETVMEIAFVAEPAGVQSRITVPMSEYTADHVAELLDAAATTINDVHAL